MEKMHHMDFESKQPEQDALDRYARFMCDPANVCKCAECPERGLSADGLPCGQQQCWVIAHCAQQDEEEDLYSGI